MAPTHMATGCALMLAGCAAAHALGCPVPMPEAITSTIVATFAALIPDIDHRSSRIARALGVSVGRVVLGPALLIAWISAWVHAMTRTAADRRNRSGHRALTHTGVFAIALGATLATVLVIAGLWVPVIGAGWWLGIPVTVGCVAHDLGDACTRTGAPLLWPARIRGQRWYAVGLPGPLRISTDTWPEHVLYMPLLVIGAAAGAWFTVT